MIPQYESIIDADISHLARASGVFIDTPAAFSLPNIGSEDKNNKYELIKHALHVFRGELLGHKFCKLIKLKLMYCW